MLDNLDYIKEIDKYNMREILERFPEQCEQAVKIGEGVNFIDLLKKKNFDKVVVCGLGGSAIGGDILKTLFSNENILIKVNRDYHLPSFVNERTLVFAVSYSGNTEETISSFKEAISSGCFVVSISSGGELRNLSDKNGVPFIKVPSGMPPRCAVGFLSIPMIVIVEKIVRKDSFDYKELVEVISVLRNRYLPEKKTEENFAKSIALKLKSKVPLIYGTSRLTDVVARRFKTQFNENSKVIASWDVFPEMNHNEIVPFSREGEIDLNIFYSLFIRDKGESERIAKRIQITQSLFSRKGINYSEIWTEGKSFITRIFSSIYTGDWISFYLAMVQATDPTPITFIDLLKNELKKAQ